MATDSSSGSNLGLPMPDPVVGRPASERPAKPTTPADASPPTAKTPRPNSPKHEAPKEAESNGAVAKDTAGKDTAAKDPGTKEKDTAATAKTAKSKDKAAAKQKAEKSSSVTTADPPNARAAKAGKADRAERRSKALEELEELDRVGAVPVRVMAPAVLISLLLHMLIVVIAGLLATQVPAQANLRELIANVTDGVEAVEEIPEMQVDSPAPDTEVTDMATDAISTFSAESFAAADIPDEPPPMASMELADIGIPTAPRGDLLKEMGSVTGTGVKGRGDAKSRAALVKQNGGTDASEAAVAAALKWFAEHQNADGSWNFDHRVGPCEGRCGDPGAKSKATLAATSMALLPFLGAGQTHKQGKYKQQVEAALYFLTGNMQANGDMTDHNEGMMYGQGISTMALCEAYAMTQDKQLQVPAQAALNFIMDAQDRVGGGWNYTPRGAGDTSIVGWQIMALKSGYLGLLQINPATIKGATKFLNSMQADGGAYYGYRAPSNAIGTTAVGLLCRMYMGWERDKPALEKGVHYLAQQGPKLNNIYYCYYATQVLHQYDGPDGPLWKEWNTKMRDSLVASQNKKGHETGSWFAKGDHGSDAGGRLYWTSMATMTLEIYYRYMPIYQQKSAESPFED